MGFKFAVIGGGAWGSAIANLLARLNNGRVIIWAKEKEVVNEINTQNKNSLFLEGIELEKNIYATDNISEADVVIDITYAPKHSGGSFDKVLKVAQTSLFSLFLNWKFPILLDLEVINFFKNLIFSFSAKFE